MIITEASKNYYNYLVSHMEEARKISLPFLKQYNLCHFWYGRIYPDGTFLDLGIDHVWFKYMLEKKYFEFWRDINIHPAQWPTIEAKFISTPKNFSTTLSTE